MYRLDIVREGKNEGGGDKGDPTVTTKEVRMWDGGPNGEVEGPPSE
jgi:hypothetical protein